MFHFIISIVTVFVRKNCLLIFVAEKRPVKPLLHMIVLSSLTKVIHYQPLVWFDLSASAALTFLSV